MYIPKHYLETDREAIISFMRQYSFAAIVTTRQEQPVANHLPFVVTENKGQLVLTSHFAKSNTQWQDLEHSNVLVIFNEPHAYISPVHYDGELNVPTWNYLAVHAYGRAEIIEEGEQAVLALEEMIGSFEPAYNKQWQGMPAEFKQKLLKGIVPFRVIITGIDAKKKLSQNKKETERNRIIDALSGSQLETERTIAHYMRENEKL